MLIYLIRHFETQWNRDKRLQGRSDQLVLPEVLEAEKSLWHLPPAFRDLPVFCSPLSRALETARVISGQDPVVHQELIEQDFGAWEGQRLIDLRAKNPIQMAEIEGQGWHLKPPQGESLLEVWQRLETLIARSLAQPQDQIWVTHKAVIRVLLARSCGWNFLGKPPFKIDWRLPQSLEISDDGKLMNITKINVPGWRRGPA